MDRRAKKILKVNLDHRDRLTLKENKEIVAEVEKLKHENTELRALISNLREYIMIQKKSRRHR